MKNTNSNLDHSIGRRVGSMWLTVSVVTQCQYLGVLTYKMCVWYNLILPAQRIVRKHATKFSPSKNDKRKEEKETEREAQPLENHDEIKSH